MRTIDFNIISTSDLEEIAMLFEMEHYDEALNRLSITKADVKEMRRDDTIHKINVYLQNMPL